MIVVQAITAISTASSEHDSANFVLKCGMRKAPALTEGSKHPIADLGIDPLLKCILIDNRFTLSEHIDKF